MKQSIRHIYHHNGPQPDWNSVPRGWITPEGRFLKTKEHWSSLSSQFRRPDIRSVTKNEAPEEAAEGERNAHLAYRQGWISLGHGGELNAVGHERTFKTFNHPAVLTLRKVLADVPSLTVPIETQIGDYDASRGVHEDFDVREYDLDILIKRGRLRQIIHDPNS
jgi:hypothetical protein